MRRLSALTFVVLVLGAACGVVALEAWHGPIVLALSGGHGIDTGDLLAFPLVVLALAVARRRSEQRMPGGWAGPTSMVVLGALLLLAGVVEKTGGPLVPAGGGTFDGTIHQAFAEAPVPVGRWSNVALAYDGAVLRLYVNGDEVSSRPSTIGTIQAPDTPLWIGGNRPYGEHFDGLIDEVRVYDRALSRREIADDMATGVAPAGGLVAGYAFDAGSGNTAADSSGHGNVGEIRSATWVPGRYGDALRFDGSSSVVRVPASPTLDLTRGMTLSGWIRPLSEQSGWRAIVQRQTDAYFLSASSGQQNRGGLVDDLRAALLVVVATVFGVVIATGLAPAAPARRRTWWMPVAVFVLGSLADAVLAPTGTLLGPALVAIWLAATATTVAETSAFACAAVVCIGLTLASRAGIAGVDLSISADDDGAVARAMALGALFIIAGVARLAPTRTAPGDRSQQVR